MSEPRKPEEVSFEGFFSLRTWREIFCNIKNYLNESEPFFKIIGFSVAISGLFMSLGGNDPSMRKIQAFFFAVTITLISVFIIKSFILLFRGKYGNIFGNVILVPTFIGGVLIFNLMTFLVHNFRPELLYYAHLVGIPVIGLCMHLCFVFYFRLISKIKKIEGRQLETFFIISLDLYLALMWAFSKDLAGFLNNLSLNTIYFFVGLLLFTTYSELFPLLKWRTWWGKVIDMTIMTILLLVGIMFFIYSSVGVWNSVTVLFSK